MKKVSLWTQGGTNVYRVDGNMHKTILLTFFYCAGSGEEGVMKNVIKAT